MMYLRYVEALLFGALLAVSAFVLLFGGFFTAGSAAFIPNNIYFVPIVAFSLLAASFALIRFSTSISEYLGHRTYLSPEEYVRRMLLVFILLLIPYALYVPLLALPAPLFSIILLVISILCLFAAISVAVDGHRLITALDVSIRTVGRRIPYVLEFLLLSLLLLVPALVLDVFGGWWGSVFAALLITFLAIPWLVAEITLIYLLRYPLVRSTLRKLESP